MNFWYSVVTGSVVKCGYPLSCGVARAVMHCSVRQLCLVCGVRQCVSGKECDCTCGG